MSDPSPFDQPRPVAPGAGPTPSPSREREGSETCVRAAGAGRGEVGADERPARGKRWTPARQAAFLRVLKETESVSVAAARVGMSRQSAYKLRKRLAGQPFDRGWELAVADLRLEEALEPMAGSGRCPVCGASPARPWAAPPGRGRW
jgi:hypothetical protein